MRRVQRLLDAGGGEKTRGATSRLSSRHLKPVATEHLCPVCGGRFTQPSDLSVHLSKIHNIKTEVVDKADTSSAAAAAAAVVADQLTLADSLAMHIYREHDVHTSPALSVK